MTVGSKVCLQVVGVVSLVEKKVDRVSRDSRSFVGRNVPTALAGSLVGCVEVSAEVLICGGKNCWLVISSDVFFSRQQELFLNSHVKIDNSQNGRSDSQVVNEDGVLLR